MAYDERLAGRIREELVHLAQVEEKAMFGGLAFMVNGKMCVGIIKDDLMCRIAPELEMELLEKKGARQMDFTGKPMKGYVLVDETGMKTKKELGFWVQLCLDFNDRAKASKKK